MVAIVFSYLFLPFAAAPRVQLFPFHCSFLPCLPRRLAVRSIHLALKLPSAQVATVAGEHANGSGTA